MKFLVSGSRGLIGSELVDRLMSDGHQVTRLIRPPSSEFDVRSPVVGTETVTWDPNRGEIETEGLEGHDVLVHLAGENIAARRWNEAQKERLHYSRVVGTRFLCDHLMKLSRPPSVMITASAVGFYGSCGEEELDESSPVGEGFLAELCQEWENAHRRLEKQNENIRIVQARFGVVLSPAGGALRKMLTPFLLGGGGVIGSGRQYWSWIDIQDLLSALEYMVRCEDLRGPVNVVSPRPVTNREFTKTLGKVLRRPTCFPLPAFAARMVLGEMADEMLLASQRVMPTKLLESEFAFQYADLESSLRHLLGRSTDD